MKLKLLLTCDYEVFGDGSGCLEKCVIHPANKLMQICEEAGARMTFFVDVCEYWAFKQAESEGYVSNNPATQIEHQLKDAIKRGHDVQLHLHPQWLEYSYEGEENWVLKMDWWRLPQVYNNEEEFIELFLQGKRSLEELLQPIDSNYKCVSFRAGALCIQPEDVVLPALRKAGFKYDSSVAPGLYREDDNSYLDFRKNDQVFQYPVSRSLSEVDYDSTFYERPLLVSSFNALEKIYFKLIRKSGLSNRPHDCQSKANTSINTNDNMVKRLFDKLKPDNRVLDLTGAISAHELFHILKKGYKKVEHLKFDKEEMNEVVAISHCKNLGNEAEIKNFLKQVNKSSFAELEKIEEPSSWRD